jgi:large conductance mechanosensitive channel
MGYFAVLFWQISGFVEIPQIKRSKPAALRPSWPWFCPIPGGEKMIDIKDPAKKALSLFEEFKNFALKGNVIDLAVAVVIGAAFNTIVTSLVKNIVMPIVSIPIPTHGGYTDWQIGPVLLGHFLADVLNFLVVALALFIFIVKFLGWIMRTKTEAPPPALTKDQELLIEIRDLLKTQRATSDEG